MFYNFCALDAMLYGAIFFLLIFGFFIFKNLTLDDMPVYVQSPKGCKIICRVWDNSIGGYRLEQKTNIPDTVKKYMFYHDGECVFGNYLYEKVVVA